MRRVSLFLLAIALFLSQIPVAAQDSGTQPSPRKPGKWESIGKGAGIPVGACIGIAVIGVTAKAIFLNGLAVGMAGGGTAAGTRLGRIMIGAGPVLGPLLIIGSVLLASKGLGALGRLLDRRSSSVSNTTSSGGLRASVDRMYAAIDGLNR